MTSWGDCAAQTALAELAVAVDQLKSGDPLKTVTILAPSNLAAITARRHLASNGGIAAVNVTTLTRYAETLAAPLLAARRPATRAVVAAAWRESLAQEPGAFEQVAEHPSTVGALARAYRDLRELDAAALDFISTQPTPAPDLVRLHRQVEASLGARWYDDIDLLHTATNAAHPDAEPVVVYLPGRSTPSEQRFLDTLHVTRTVVTVDLHPTTTATRVLHASDSDDEVRAVVRDLMSSLSEGRKVAVLYANPRPYNRLLAEQLATAGITINGPGSRPVVERVVVRTFLELIDLADQDLPRAALFQTLGGASVRDFDGNLIPTARWERHSRAAGVVRGDHWAERLQGWIDDEARDWETESAGRLHAFANELRRRFSASHSTWKDAVDWASDLYATLLVDDDRLRHLPPEEQHAHTALQLALRSLAVLDDTTTAPSIRALHDLLTVDLETSVPRVGRFGDGVYVGPVTTGSGLAVDVTYVLGLSEDLYPGNPAEDVLLPDRIRAHLDGALPSLRDRIDDRRRALEAAFSTAPEVVASFPRGDLRQTKDRLPSRWLLPTLHRLAEGQTFPATKWESIRFPAGAVQAAGSFAGELLTSDHLATEQEWRVRAGVAGVLADVVVESAAEVLRARASDDFTRFDGNLAGLDGLTDFRLGDHAISPTGLEKYASCPHAYFVERMLGVRPVENPEDIVTIPASELGTFIHSCMDELTKQGNLPGAGEPWSAAHHQTLRKIADRKAADLEKRGVTGHQRLWAVEKERVVLTLTKMLDEDSEWRATSKAAVRAAELEFGLNGKPPIQVAVPGGTITMKGSADKIDVSDSRVYVTDIKSGRRASFTSIKQSDPAPHGSKLQLPAYAYAALAVLDLDLPVTAGYWFVHKDSGRVDLEFDDTVRQRYGQVLRVLAAGIAGGLYPARPPATDDFTFVLCAFCNPDSIGYATARREWAAKSAHPDLAELVALIVDNEVSDD